MNEKTPLSCDGCTLCCNYMKIRELAKAAYSWCVDCKVGEGCGNYEQRPQSCRDYACIWLQTQTMDKPIAPELRPDKSKVIIGTTNQGNDIVLYVPPSRPDAWKHKNFAGLVSMFIAKGTPVFVSCGEKLDRIG